MQRDRPIPYPVESVFDIHKILLRMPSKMPHILSVSPKFSTVGIPYPPTRALNYPVHHPACAQFPQYNRISGRGIGSHAPNPFPSRPSIPKSPARCRSHPLRNPKHPTARLSLSPKRGCIYRFRRTCPRRTPLLAIQPRKSARFWLQSRNARSLLNDTTLQPHGLQNLRAP